MLRYVDLEVYKNTNITLIIYVSSVMKSTKNRRFTKIIVSHSFSCRHGNYKRKRLNTLKTM